MASASDDLVRTRVLFEQWRSTRQGRSKIPDELWQAAVALHGRYSASQLCRELHLSAGALRSRLPQTTPNPAVSRPVFVPLPAGIVSLADSGSSDGCGRRDPLGLGAD
jgi:hypothetical protein